MLSPKLRSCIGEKRHIEEAGISLITSPIHQLQIDPIESYKGSQGPATHGLLGQAKDYPKCL